MTNTTLVAAQYQGKGTNAYFNYIDVGATNVTAIGLLANRTTGATSAATFGTIGAVTGTGIVFCPVVGVDFAANQPLGMFHVANTNVIQQDIPFTVVDWSFRAQNALPPDHMVQTGRFLTGNLANLILTQGSLPVNCEWVETLGGGTNGWQWSIQWQDTDGSSPTAGQTIEIGSTVSGGESPNRHAFTSGTNWNYSAFAGTVDHLSSGTADSDTWITTSVAFNPGTWAANLANVDAAVSTRLATSGYTSPTSVANITNLSNLDAAVSSRQATNTNLGYLDVAVSSRQATIANVTNLSNLDAAVSAIPTNVFTVGGTNTIRAVDGSGNALFTAASGTSVSTLTAAQVDTQLSGVHGSGSWGSAATGSGAYAVDVNPVNGTNALNGVNLRVSNGGVTYASNTGTNTTLRFNIDAGTWTVSARKEGYSSTGTSQLVGSDLMGTNGVSVTLTPVSVAVPANPTQTTAYLTTLDAHGAAEGGVVIQFECIGGPGTAGYSYDSGPITATSSTSIASLGELTCTLPQSSSYRVSRGRKITTMQTGTNTTVAIPEILGTP